MNRIIIADIAGQFDALERLIAKLPEGEIILVGDLNDRGPKSKEVIEWAISQNIYTVHSNHGDLFVDYYLSIMDSDYERRYWPEDFYNNGGLKTLRSYDCAPGFAVKIPLTHIRWLKNRPVFYNTSDLIVSHAPIVAGLKNFDEKSFSEDHRSYLVWNRDEPQKIEGKLQVFGHNSNWGVREFRDEQGLWAICIDDSRKDVLTAYVIENGKNEGYVVQEPYGETNE